MAYQRCLIRAGEDLVMGNVQVYKHLASLDDAPFHIQMNCLLVQNGCALTSHFEPFSQELRCFALPDDLCGPHACLNSLPRLIWIGIADDLLLITSAASMYACEASAVSFAG